MNEIKLSDITYILQQIVDLIFQSWYTLIGFFMLLGFLAWFIMAYALNVDDRTHKMLTIVMMIFLFFAVLVMADKGMINLSLESVKSLI